MIRALLLATILAVLTAVPADARNTEHLFDVKDAVDHGAGNANLLDIPY